MRRDTENWLASADYDIETASHMLATGRYLYVIFMCHLAVEKLLKAVAAEHQGKAPPRTHDLIYLMKLADVHLSSTRIDFLGKLNNASLPTRYPEDLAKAVSAYPTEVGGRLSPKDTGACGMAEAKPEIKNIVEKYRQQLAGLGVRAERIYLYGSYAKGMAREGSDIDLIVVSQDFSSRNVRERLEVLGVAAARLLTPIQALGYTPEEIVAGAYSPFLEEVLSSEAIAM